MEIGDQMQMEERSVIVSPLLSKKGYSVMIGNVEVYVKSVYVCTDNEQTEIGDLP